MAAGIREPNGTLGLKCFSNYCFHYGFVVLRLDTQQLDFMLLQEKLLIFLLTYSDICWRRIQSEDSHQEGASLCK